MEPHRGSKILHEASVEAKLTLDAAQRFVAYEELAPIRKRLVVKTRSDGAVAFPSMPTQPARWVEPPATAKILRDGTVVEDLGDSFTCGVESSEVDTVRKVRVDGQTAWLLERCLYNTGHNFVGEDVLVAVPETVNAPPSDRGAGKP